MSTYIDFVTLQTILDRQKETQETRSPRCPGQGLDNFYSLPEKIVQKISQQYALTESIAFL